MEEKKRLEQERIRCEQERHRLEQEIKTREEKEAQLREQQVCCNFILSDFLFTYHIDIYIYHMLFLWEIIFSR